MCASVSRHTMHMNRDSFSADPSPLFDSRARTTRVNKQNKRLDASLMVQHVFFILNLPVSRLWCARVFDFNVFGCVNRTRVSEHIVGSMKLTGGFAITSFFYLGKRKHESFSAFNYIYLTRRYMHEKYFRVD